MRGFDKRGVSIHASARDATIQAVQSPYVLQVSIHASARDATISARCTMPFSGFNPRVRAGRDKGVIARCVITHVSIHASARDATSSSRRRWARPRCFNPRVRAGRDKRYAMLQAVADCFNPRVRAGRDEQYEQVWKECRVSIHASARDATWSRRGRRQRSLCFNPRVRAGRDHSYPRSAAPAMFQSTRPRGTRPLPPLLRLLRPVSIHASARDATGFGSGCRGSPSFNPRVRAGRDEPLGLAHGVAVVSIHASARDATPSSSCTPLALLFQSTRPRGTRHMYTATYGGSIEFQSTRPRGTRRVPEKAVLGTCVFQSTRPRGTRPAQMRVSSLTHEFQSTRPRGTRPV